MTTLKQDRYLGREADSLGRNVWFFDIACPFKKIGEDLLHCLETGQVSGKRSRQFGEECLVF